MRNRMGAACNQGMNEDDHTRNSFDLKLTYALTVATAKMKQTEQTQQSLVGTFLIIVFRFCLLRARVQYAAPINYVLF